jgi:hypothetical protein
MIFSVYPGTVIVCVTFLVAKSYTRERQPTKVSAWAGASGRGTYEVVQTYEQGSARRQPFAWAAGGQYMAWLAVQAAGAPQHP